VIEGRRSRGDGRGSVEVGETIIARDGERVGGWRGGGAGDTEGGGGRVMPPPVKRRFGDGCIDDGLGSNRSSCPGAASSYFRFTGIRITSLLTKGGRIGDVRSRPSSRTSRSRSLLGPGTPLETNLRSAYSLVEVAS